MHVLEWVSSRRFGARLAFGTALVALAVGVTACGSSSSSSGSGGSGGSGGDATAASQPASADKTAQIAALTKRPTHIAVTVPVGKPIPTGKKVIYIPPPLGDQKPAEKILGQAARALGWTSSAIVPTSATTSAFAAGIDEALRQKADAIILVSFPGTALAGPIARAKAQGVPVINLYASEPPGTVPGIVAQPLGKSYTIKVAERTGELLGLMVPPGSTVGEAALLVVTKATEYQQATERGVKKTCPTCKYAANITLAAQAKDYVPNMVTFIRKEKLKGLYILNGPLSNGLGAAMRAAGEDPNSVKALAGTIGSGDGSAQRVNNSEAPLAAGYVWPGAEGIWYGVDAAARALAGVSTKPSDSDAEPYIVLPGKIPSEVLNSPSPVAVTDYQAEFAKLWGK